MNSSDVKAALKEASDAIWQGHNDDAVETLEELLPSLQGRAEFEKPSC